MLYLHHLWHRSTLSSTVNRTMSIITDYLKSRFTTLIPTKEEIKRDRRFLNPFPALKSMTRSQWNHFLLAFFCWTYDSMDYFTITLNVPLIAKDLGASVKQITWGMTLVMMMRSPGALILGFLGDKYGRRWPMVANLVLFAIIQIGTGFVTTYQQFLAVRALFGMAMGALYGIASATALEPAPPNARSFLSGLFQQGYALGYLLAVVFQRAITYNEPKHTWRSFIWFSGGLSVLLIIWRVLTPESAEFMQQQYHMKNTGTTFYKEGKKAIKEYWKTFLYLILLISGFSFMSHGSQDLYPTLLTTQLGFSRDRSTVTNIIANCGALCGGITIGHFSGILGRRLAVIFCCVIGGAMIYPWAFARNSGINAGVFFLQFCVQGAWGVMPIHLSELSAPEFKAFMVGVSYQLGNLASSASTTIEATIGESFPIYDENGNKKPEVYNYALVMAILIGCVFTYVLIMMLLGPEKRNANINYELDDDSKLAIITEEGKGSRNGRIETWELVDKPGNDQVDYKETTTSLH